MAQYTIERRMLYTSNGSEIVAIVATLCIENERNRQAEGRFNRSE